MMEWRDENYRRLVKIGKDSKFKYKEENWVFIIRKGDYKRKSYLNPYTNPIFYINQRLSDVILNYDLDPLFNLASTINLNTKQCESAA